MHGGTARGPLSPPAIGYSAARKKCAQADFDRCRRLGIKRPSGRRKGSAWVTEAMVERASTIAKPLGYWGLPSRERKLIWWLLKAGKDETARPRAQAMLREAEKAAAKAVLEELLGR